MAKHGKSSQRNDYIKCCQQVINSLLFQQVINTFNVINKVINNGNEKVFGAFEFPSLITLLITALITY